MAFPFQDTETAFKALLHSWNQAMIGSPRGEDGTALDPEPRFAPFTVAKGSSDSGMDAGVVVPVGAMRNVAAFTTWARDNGFEQGISLRVDGLIRGPGNAKWAKPKKTP
jgi:hypothetical protein